MSDKNIVDDFFSDINAELCQQEETLKTNSASSKLLKRTLAARNDMKVSTGRWTTPTPEDKAAKIAAGRLVLRALREPSILKSESDRDEIERQVMKYDIKVRDLMAIVLGKT